MKPVLLLLGFLLASLLLLTLPATDGQSGIPSQPPTAIPSGTPAPSAAPLRVTTRLVQINVLVHDHHGTPIADLAKDDFEISDHGKVQSVAVFTVESLTAAQNADKQKKPQATMPRNVVTNRPERQGNMPTSVTVLLLDMYNTKMTDQVYARKQTIRFLRQIRPEDRIAVYLLNGKGFSVIHDFTNSSESLLASLSKVLPGFSHELDSSSPDASNTGNDETDTFIDTANTVMSNFYTRNRVINTCLAFKMLANHLSGVPGRKNVVWVSGGFPIAFGYGDSQDTTDQSQLGTTESAASQDRELFASYIEDASLAMNTANAAVYPVDARGLMGLPFADASRSIKLNSRSHQLPDNMMHVDQKNMDTMNYIADLTGGKAYYNTNDIEGAIRKAIDDSSVTYTLGYYVSADNWDGKFHKLKVKVKRSGAVVRTKKGYLATEQPTPTPKRLSQALQEAVWSPLDSTTIGVMARIDPSAALPNASRFTFVLDPAEIQFQPEDINSRGSIDLVMVQQTKDGKRIATVKKTLTFSVTPAQMSVMRVQGMRAGQDVPVNAETESVRIVVLDRGSGATGSVTMPVALQDKSGANVTLPASSQVPK